MNVRIPLMLCIISLLCCFADCEMIQIESKDFGNGKKFVIETSKSRQKDKSRKLTGDDSEPSQDQDEDLSEGELLGIKTN